MACVTYITISRVSAQSVTSINIGGEGDLHQYNSINTYRLRGIDYDAKDICKLTHRAVSLLLTTLQAILCNYPGNKIILAERKVRASAQH